MNYATTKYVAEERIGKSMKRYVKEFANDEMKCCTEERKTKIRHVLKVYEKGLVTSFEAVKMICDTYYDER